MTVCPLLAIADRLADTGLISDLAGAGSVSAECSEPQCGIYM
jgi:hypothetical protein